MHILWLQVHETLITDGALFGFPKGLIGILKRIFSNNFQTCVDFLVVTNVKVLRSLVKDDKLRSTQF